MKQEAHPASLAAWTLLIAIIVSIFVGALATLPAQAAEPAKRTGTAVDKAARGKYIVNTAGCHDCHTPFKPTRQRRRARHDAGCCRAIRRT